jgi:hypothetical protein
MRTIHNASNLWIQRVRISFLDTLPHPAILSLVLFDFVFNAGRHGRHGRSNMAFVCAGRVGGEEVGTYADGEEHDGRELGGER